MSLKIQFKWWQWDRRLKIAFESETGLELQLFTSLAGDNLKNVPT